MERRLTLSETVARDEEPYIPRGRKRSHVDGMPYDPPARKTSCFLEPSYGRKLSSYGDSATQSGRPLPASRARMAKISP